MLYMARATSTSGWNRCGDVTDLKARLAAGQINKRTTLHLHEPQLFVRSGDRSDPAQRDYCLSPTSICLGEVLVKAVRPVLLLTTGT